MLKRELPGWIQQEKFLYANDLVTVHTATDVSSGSQSLVLRAPAATAACLETAKKCIDALNDATRPPLAALPTLLTYGELHTRGVFIVLGDIRGEQLRQRLLHWQDNGDWNTLNEDEILQIAQFHLELLEAMHEIGYSGLHSTPREVWWAVNDDDFWLRLLIPM